MRTHTICVRGEVRKPLSEYFFYLEICIIFSMLQHASVDETSVCILGDNLICRFSAGHSRPGISQYLQLTTGNSVL